MDKPKKVNFLYDDPDTGGMIIGGTLQDPKHIRPGILDALRAYIHELEDGEEWTVTIKRHDMTDEEIEAIPEL